jgi:hypothetical protein
VSDALPDPAAVLAHYLRQAVAESKLAYRFSPSSYSYSCLNACLAAEQALEVLRDTLDAAAETGREPINPPS